MNVYRLLDRYSPGTFEPIKKKSVAGFVRQPGALISPTIDGLITDYFEWLAAGLYDLTNRHRRCMPQKACSSRFFTASTGKGLYFRIDGVTAEKKPAAG